MIRRYSMIDYINTGGIVVLIVLFAPIWLPLYVIGWATAKVLKGAGR